MGTPRPVGGGDLLLAGGATLLVALTGCLLLGERRQQRGIVVRWILLAIIGGMLAYILYALQVIRPETWGILPETAWMPRLAMMGLVIMGAFLPLVAMRTADRRD
jgi:hypothetical protein